jgi:hypothetical protein
LTKIEMIFTDEQLLLFQQAELKTQNVYLLEWTYYKLTATVN